MQLRTVLPAVALLASSCIIAPADSLLVGFNTQTPVQVYSLTGTYQQDFGPASASAGIEENGLLYVVQPSLTGTTSTITGLNAAQTAVSTFTVSDLIGDGAPGANGSLWLAGYDGTVYNVSSTGQVLSSFSTGYTNIGIATNGTTLYTTEGNSGDGIDIRNSSGAIQTTLHTGISSLYGIGYDTTDGDLFAGGFNYLYQFDLSGALLNTLNLPGDSRTANGSVHDGVETGDLALLTGPTGPGGGTTVPEPGTMGLFLMLLIPCAVYGIRKRSKVVLNALLAGIGITSVMSAAVNVSLSASSTSVAVGTPVLLSTTASDTSSSSAVLTYQYEVRAPGASSFALLKDYYTTRSFSWAPTAHEGSYEIQVNVRSSSGASASAQIPINVTSRVSGSTPVISATQNPLVALYSAPACTSPAQVRVRFKTSSASAWAATPFQACDGLSLNFLIGGMYANTTYQMQQDTYRGPFDTPGPVLTFVTGTIPSNIPFPTRTTQVGPVAPTSMSFPLVLQIPNLYPFATDLYGNIVWYSAALNNSNPNEQGGLYRNVTGGTFLGAQDDPNDHCPGTTYYCGDHQFLREWDLAGNVVRETNWTILNQEVNAMRASAGKSAVNLSQISHDSIRLPNGNTAVIISDQRVANQGQGPVLVDGDCILVLDSNFYPVWFWDAFDWLDITRKALGNETCVAGQNGCAIPRVKMANGQYYTIANDWTHMNSVTLDPKDNNLIASSRHQSLIYKLDYANGAGDGHIIWSLGNGGTFSLAAGVPASAWFSYQHAAQFQPNGALTLFDDNNLQHNANGANSRGQAWSLDEQHMIATPILNVDLGAYSLAVGYASELSNGNYHFGSGFLNTGTQAESYEYTPNGTLVYKQFVNSFSYRPIRLSDLYTAR